MCDEEENTSAFEWILFAVVLVAEVGALIVFVLNRLGVIGEG